jgi:DNA-binding Lrp family transcriptional regulator
MINAYVLIETAVGQTKEVYKALLDKKVKEIKTVDVVTGPYDIIVVLEHDDVSAVGALIIDKLHTIPGIVRSVTCLGVTVT